MNIQKDKINVASLSANENRFKIVENIIKITSKSLYYNGNYNSISLDIIKDNNINILLCDAYYFVNALYNLNEIKESSCRLILVSSDVNWETVLFSTSNGFSGLLSLMNIRNNLHDAIDSILFDCWKFIDPIYHSIIMEKLLKQTSDNLIDSSKLTKRENEILEILHLHSILNVGKHLYISEKTVHTHCRNIMYKLNIKDLRTLRLHSLRNAL